MAEADVRLGHGERSPDSKRQRNGEQAEAEIVVISSSSESESSKSDTHSEQAEVGVVVSSESESSKSDSEQSSFPITKLSLSDVDRLIERKTVYYDDDQSLPILERIAPSRRRLYAAEDIAWLLTDPSVKTSKIVCTKVPTFIQESVSFIVNLDSLENPDDVLADDLGAWKHNGVDTCHVHISFSRRVKKVEKCKPGMSSASSYLVKRAYRIHGTDETLKKLTAYVYDPSGKLSSLVLVVYKFDRVPDHAVMVRPHGNAKRNKPYRRTRESLLEAEMKHSTPKNAVDKVFASRGVAAAKSVGELPRGRNQAYNIKKKQQQRALAGFTDQSSVTSTRDMLYVVMARCKLAEKTNLFVQDVTCAPEPMGVLCNEQQLLDLERFCCNPFNFCICGIDPTFNFGEFSVTPMVYRHLLLENPQTGRSPILIGPMLVHSRKLFRSYNYFFSTLNGLKQEVAAIKAVGTDGEKNIVDAALRNFPQATHVRCFRHLQQNVEMHLHDHQFPTATIKGYTHDIFGWTDSSDVYHEGLVDCTDTSDFDSSLATLKPKWDQMESLAFKDEKSHKVCFHTWFTTYKADEFRCCTLRSLREEIGLGSPPVTFYTNDSESLNALLKESLGYKKHQRGHFNDKVKQVIEQQQQEMEKAIIGYGEYQLRKQYSFLAVSEEKWFRMSGEQRN